MKVMDLLNLKVVEEVVLNQIKTVFKLLLMEATEAEPNLVTKLRGDVETNMKIRRETEEVTGKQINSVKRKILVKKDTDLVFPK